jgi:hypothetical protein
MDIEVVTFNNGKIPTGQEEGTLGHDCIEETNPADGSSEERLINE